MLLKRIEGQWLSENIGRLLLRVNPTEREGGILPAGVLQEVEVLVVDVLSSRAHPRELSNRQRTIVILECFAMDNWTLGKDGEPEFLHLVQNVLMGNGSS